jgi:hypothetical protein
VAIATNVKKAPNVDIVAKVKGLQGELASSSNRIFCVRCLPMQKMWQQSQAGYHYEGWESNTVEDAKNANKRKHNARPNGRPLLRIRKQSFACSKVLLLTLF